MSEAIAFDTHRYVKRLTENGFTEQQAETLADEQVTLLNANLATKADLARIGADVEAHRQETQAGMEALRQETKAGIEALRQETKAGIETLRQETKADIAALKAELIKWVFGVMFAMTGLFAAIVKLT